MPNELINRDSLDSTPTLLVWRDFKKSSLSLHFFKCLSKHFKRRATFWMAKKLNKNLLIQKPSTDFSKNKSGNYVTITSSITPLVLQVRRGEISKSYFSHFCAILLQTK